MKDLAWYQYIKVKLKQNDQCNHHVFIKKLLWYSNQANLVQLKMMHKFSYEHNRSKITVMHPKIIGKIYLEPNYANLVIKNNKIIYI